MIDFFWRLIDSCSGALAIIVCMACAAYLLIHLLISLAGM